MQTGQVFPWSSRGPRAGVLPFLACLPWPAPHFSACESALSQRQAGLSSCPPPPALNGQGRPLSLLRHFVPRLKSLLYMPLAPPQPVIQAGPRGPGEAEHQGVSWPGPQGRRPQGSQATRAPHASACDLRPFQPQLAAAATAAKSLQSCPTLCNPIDGSPPGSSVPGILQARTLEWVAISFSSV